jgi:hypothetical protein
MLELVYTSNQTNQANLNVLKAHVFKHCYYGQVVVILLVCFHSVDQV